MQFCSSSGLPGALGSFRRILGTGPPLAEIEYGTLWTERDVHVFSASKVKRWAVAPVQVCSGMNEVFLKIATRLDPG